MSTDQQLCRSRTCAVLINFYDRVMIHQLSYAQSWIVKATHRRSGLFGSPPKIQDSPLERRRERPCHERPSHRARQDQLPDIAHRARRRSPPGRPAMPIACRSTDQPWDVSDPDLYYNDTWQPIFKEMREQAPVNKLGGTPYGEFWNVTTLKAIHHVEALPKVFLVRLEERRHGHSRSGPFRPACRRSTRIELPCHGPARTYARAAARSRRHSRRARWCAFPRWCARGRAKCSIRCRLASSSTGSRKFRSS